ncbi:hypothetical protein EGR_09866 [Echinococcus granulosus]|uniref:Uncharacterized protein n=1 Tax=Echinococcus granulosus TaxID=6210 RepID=W6U2C8_ECHGR|nr:hypothetical protein EGR_09866 [Echinococcus granulosus]EUB55265.1 hypothetical protein EGR_09866 [Echinococcus granulosus]
MRVLDLPFLLVNSFLRLCETLSTSHPELFFGKGFGFPNQGVWFHLSMKVFILLSSLKSLKHRSLEFLNRVGMFDNRLGAIFASLDSQNSSIGKVKVVIGLKLTNGGCPLNPISQSQCSDSGVHRREIYLAPYRLLLEKKRFLVNSGGGAASKNKAIQKPSEGVFS